MESKWSGVITLAIFIGITAFGFIFWVLGLLLIWGILTLFGLTIDLFSMIEALSTAVATAAVLGAGYIAYRELNEASDSRYLEVADRLFKELNSAENIEARRVVYQSLADDPKEGLESMPPEVQTAVKRVLNSLDRVAFLTQSGWIPDSVFMPWMHPMIAKSWDKLAPYVMYERERRNEPYYYEHAGKLAESCEKWRAKHLSDGDVHWVDDAL